MKSLVIALLIVAAFAMDAYCAVRYINQYQRRDGTIVGGHWRDTSNDGYKYSNANELGYND